MEEKHIYEIIVEELGKISKCKVEFGFIEDYTIANLLSLEGKFLVMGDDLSSETYNISHNKQFDRTIKVDYVKTNNRTTNSLNELIKIEKILKELTHKILQIRRVLEMDYSFSIELLKEQESDLTGVLNVKIILEIKER